MDGNRSSIRNVFQRKTMGNVQNKVMFVVTKRRKTHFVYVLLTVHLSIILAIDQLNAQTLVL